MNNRNSSLLAITLAITGCVLLSQCDTGSGTGPNAAPFTDTLAVTSPNGGETYSPGDTLTVTWLADTALVADVQVFFSLDDGDSWWTISPNSIPSSAPSFGTFSWAIPDSLPDGFIMVSTESPTCRIKVQEYNLEFLNDESDGSFLVTNDRQQPTQDL